MEQISGERVKIWRNPNPQGPNDSDERVLELLPNVKALISVVSPPFLKSNGCRREVEQFWKSAESSGQLQVENKSRVFKVVKRPVPSEEVPPPLSDIFPKLLDFGIAKSSVTRQ